MKSATHVLEGALSRLGLATATPAETVVELPPRSYAPPPSKTAAAVAAVKLTEFDLDYDAEEKILWSYFDFSGRPCFRPEVLEETQRVQRLVRDLTADASVGEPPLRYVVMGSRMPGVWNLGGDLEFFAEHIRNRDRPAL